ncbi:MAG: dihydrolipoyl dehydrogenase [Candidatus Omnitrophota bacterium]|nr:dihydrolipoyl dehydrogenase [Candidatus Omnitrophota bacterium]
MGYDLAVVGSGPGGCAAALTAARRGLQVCLIEREEWGGVCLNVGCIPTKALVTVAQFVRRLQQARQLGVVLAGYTLDYPAVIARTARIVATLRRGLTELLQREGVELIQGSAAFEHPTRLLVTAAHATRVVDAARIVLATGARPSAGPWTFDEQRVVSYRGLLALPSLPQSLLIIGGGVIGCEFASCLAAFGTTITIVEQEPSLLPGEDPDAVRWLTRRLEQEGVTLLTGRTVQRLEASASWVEARLSDGTPLVAERCLIAVGQHPTIEGLRLSQASMAFARGVTVDPFLRTSQPHIAAIGDCLDGHGLAHWAGAEGGAAVRNLLGDPPESIDASEVPRCVFTEPEIAQVGMRAAEGDDGLRVSRFSFGALGKSHCDDATEGFVKLVVDRATERIRGATIVGDHASSLIHAAGLAIRHGLTAKQLARTITAHPTLPEGLTEAAAHFYGQSLVLASGSRSSVQRSAFSG